MMICKQSNKTMRGIKWQESKREVTQIFCYQFCYPTLLPTKSLIYKYLPT